MRPGMTEWRVGEGSGVVAPNPGLGAIGPDRLLTIDKPAIHRLNLKNTMGRIGPLRTSTYSIRLGICWEQCWEQNERSGYHQAVPASRQT
jgi:hypothetical protein